MLLHPSLSCIISLCCQYSVLILSFEAFSVSLTIAKFKIQGLAVKDPCDTHSSLIFFLLLPQKRFHHVILLSSPLILITVNFLHMEKKFLILYIVIFLKNSFISDYPLICRHLLLFLSLHKKATEAPGGKQVLLLIKALFYSEYVFVQIYLQVYLIRRIWVIYLIRNNFICFGFMAKSGPLCALLSWEIPL